MTRRFLVRADGGSRGNPGPAGFGAVVYDAQTHAVMAEASESIGIASNNVAEYGGLIAGLRAAFALDPAAEIDVEMDSKLVVEQMSGRWQIKHEDMRRLAREARAVIGSSRVRFQWIPRAQNSHADRLANQAMDAAARSGGRGSGAGASFAAQASRPVQETLSVGETASGAAESPVSPSVTPPTAPSTPMPSSSRAPLVTDGAQPTTLILVRHGRTVLTEQGRFSGLGGEDPPLSELGLDDAARVARRLGALSAEGEGGSDVHRPTLVISSPLQRCRQTGGAIATAVGVPVVFEEGWAEVAFGIWDGLTYAEVARRWPKDLASWRGSIDFAPEGAETVRAFQARITSTLARTLREYQGQTLVVSTHTTPVRAVVASALDAGPLALWRLRIAPASVSIVRFWGDLDDLAAGGGAVEVLTVNASDHLG